MIKAGKSPQEGLVDWLKNNPKYQQEYLKASLEENYDMPRV
jgi:hypothetical protein